MLDKYFNGVIEQTYNRVGTWEKNVVAARYTNDFSLSDLDSVKRYSTNVDNVFFACFEYDYDTITGAYEPFFSIIIDLFHSLEKEESFGDFLEACGVYSLHKEVLLGIYNGTELIREEPVLLAEVAYEQKLLTNLFCNMLLKLSEERPVLIVLNRFQLAPKSTFTLVKELMERPSANIGLVLACNDAPSMQSSSHKVWSDILEGLDDENRVYHIGDSGISRSERIQEFLPIEKIKEEVYKIRNTAFLLDYEHACFCIERVENYLRSNGIELEAGFRNNIIFMHAHARIFRGEISTALEILGHLEKQKKTTYERYQYEYLKSVAYMYQGKLPKSFKHIEKCKAAAKTLGDAKWIFVAELLEVEAKMSGWYNIFFCVQDIDISEELIEKMMKYDFMNHLAHVYIYAYDNRPELVAKTYRTESALVHFSSGVELAKKIGNYNLVYNAYQKNLMISSANGMFEIALLYSVRIYQTFEDKECLEVGRIYSSIGYNLSALGKVDLADLYYKKAIQILYRLRLPVDIAEVHYNMALNSIQKNNYEEAEHYLLLCMKAIERLHLNSLRVANLSKLYALLALVSVMLGDRLNSERYLINCRQFLNYVMEKDNKEIGIVHDYAVCDDDLFLYTFARGLVNLSEDADEQALECFLQAEKYLMNSEGNQFFIQKIFRMKRMELFKRMGRQMLYEIEEQRLNQKIEVEEADEKVNLGELLKDAELQELSDVYEIEEEWIENLMKQEGLALDLMNNRRQLDFISSWQKQVGVTNIDTNLLVEQAMHTFLNHFNNDCALYIRYHRDTANVLYNNTEVRVTNKMLNTIKKMMKEYPQGFAVSKISGNYFEYQELISYFGIDEVCSFVAVPFFKEHTLQSVLITYVFMQDNWHSSFERYMLDEDDLHIYKLLFQEISYSINRMEAYEAVFEMNKRLSQMAVSDLLTGIYNRNGMYQQMKEIVDNIKLGKREGQIGVMFIDLDNFKNYNDTFGHNIGDRMLVEMTQIFKSSVGDRGVVCRYGGDEFIILLDTCDKTILEAIAEDIFAQIHEKNGFVDELVRWLEKPVHLKEKEKLSCSIGIAMNENVTKEEDLHELLKRADRKLYEVKEGTKGTYAST